MNDSIHSYIEGLVKERNLLLTEMEIYAKEQKVPIMELVGIENLLQLLRIQQPARILEVGTAIGYSVLRMAEALPQGQFVTIERDLKRYKEAQSFIARSEAKDRITLIHGDALDVNEIIDPLAPFDAIFIDAAKGQYKKFFELYTPMLSVAGIVYTDNVLFKGFVTNLESINSRNLKMLVKKIQHYNEWLMGHSHFQTSILPVGDGLAISIKRGETI
ncbi:O-methyltransferase [Bacillus sp. 2205SS5-2]|uniref:O-methyltransferase n=1 Tax=Bacillus sp. 2205SS5-2 TaxID=3109031 RepID=UPI003007AEBB